MSCPAPTLESGYRFTDWLGGQAIRCRALRPHCREALVTWMRAQPDLLNLRMRAVGSGHSTSPAARPPTPESVAVVVDELVIHDEEARAAEAWVRGARLRDGEHLLRVPAGTTIAALNRMLGERGWALPNMGSYDAQTVSGAVATATHGSGLVTGPLSDMVTSIELVTVVRGPRVVALRIEADDGPTDTRNFDGQRFGLEFLRSTAAFEACVVGLGAFGVVTALTLRVVDEFWLEEERWMTSWPELARDRTLLDLVEREPFVDVVMTPLPRPTHRARSHRCLVTVRRPVPAEGDPPPRDDERRRELESRLERHRDHENPCLALTHSLSRLASQHPRLANDSVENRLQEEARASRGNPFRSASHVVLRTSVGDLVLATSAEVAVPLERAVAAVEATVDHLTDLHDSGYHHGSPVGIRFGEASRHLLSMNHGRRTCTIETPLLLGMHRRSHDASRSEADIEYILGRFAERMLGDASLEARMHWGMRGLPGRERILSSYPLFGEWEARMREFNPYGIFDNALTESIVGTPAIRLREMVRTHGHEARVEHPDRLEALTAFGFCLSARGRPGIDTWLHIAIPTPVIVDGRRLGADHVTLRFRAGPRSRIRAVHLHDGETRIAAEGEIAAEPGRWHDWSIALAQPSRVYWGISLSVQVAFGEGGSSAERTFELSSVGCAFVD
jgi:L-gulono-1,4-lactone dehydrogenase